jgi:hypothetical protein
MKTKWFQSLASLLLLFVLVACTQPTVATNSTYVEKTLHPVTQSALPALPVGFPHIQRIPMPGHFWIGQLKAIPTYNPDSTNTWQMDLRAQDLTQLDLRGSTKDLLYADLDTLTQWPVGKMPDDFDW